MLAPKLPPVTLLGAVDVEGIPNFTMGSLSSIVGHNVQGYEPLMAWPEVQPDPSIRDTIRQNASDGSFDVDRPFTSQARSGRRSGAGSGSDGEDDLRHFYKGSGAGSGGGSAGADRGMADSSSSSSSSCSSRSSASGSNSGDDTASSDDSDSSSSGSSSDADSDGSSDDHRSPVKSRNGGNQLPVPFVAAKSAPSPTTRNVAPVNKTSASGSIVTTSAPLPVKGAVTVQGGIRKVAPSKGKKDAFGVDSGTMLLETSHLSHEDLVEVSTSGAQNVDAFSAPAHAPFFDDMSSYDAPLAMTQETLLVPTMAHSITPTPPSPSAATAGFGLPGTISASPVNVSTVALSAGYTGLVGANPMNKPSAMLANAGNTSPLVLGSPGSGLAGNQRMMMQTPLAITQSVQAPGGPSSTATQAGMFTAAPGLVEGESLTAARTLLKPEMGGGLAASIVFRNGVQASAFSGANPAYIILKNTRDQPIR